MRNHLFIGLGGQGGRTLGALRKVVHERAREAAELEGDHRVKLDYLAIDSSDDIRKERDAWTDFGKDLALQPADWLILNRPGQGAVGNLAIRPDISPWLGDYSIVDSFLGQGDIQGANQRRRFGRLLFASNAERIRSTIATKTEALVRNSQNQCAFHVFATLVGGTGSGGIIDLVTTLRTAYPETGTNRFPIFLYLYVADEDSQGADVGYFFQNQFATLRDLNALMCGRLNPQLMGAAAGEVFHGAEPIAQVAIASKLNSANQIVDLASQIRITAEACFERIFAYESGQMDADAQKSLTGEDLLGSWPSEPVNRGERSYRFGAFGMSRWEVPHGKLLSLLALDILKSATRQMLYCNWQNNGYADVLPEAARGESGTIVSSLLAEVSGDRFPAPNLGTLDQLLKISLREHAQGNLNSRSEPLPSLEFLEQQLGSFYQSHLDGMGIDAIVRRQEESHGERVAHAARQIEVGLSEQWTGTANSVGLARIPGILDELMASLRRELDEPQADGSRTAALGEQLAARRAEWRKLTRLSRPFKMRGMVEAHARESATVHAEDLRRRLADLDRRFLSDLVDELNPVRARFQNVTQIISDLRKSLDTECGLIDSEFVSFNNAASANRYEFDAELLERFRFWMKSHHVHQQDVAFRIRSKIADALGGPRRLTSFERGQTPEFQDLLRVEARKAAAQIHQSYVDSSAGKSVLEFRLLDTLQQRFKMDEPAFRQEVEAFIGNASVCLALRADEPQPALVLGQGIGISTMPRRLLLIGVPRHEFSEDLKEVIEDSLGAGNGIQLKTFDLEEESQIRLFSTTYWLAARFAGVVRGLGEKYERSLSGAGQGVAETRYFCNIDPDGEQDLRPSLFLLNDSDMRLRYEGELWLGGFLECVAVNAEDGIYRIDGGRVPQRLGANLAEALQQANLDAMSALHERVVEEVAAQATSTTEALLDTKRDALEREHGITSEEYRRWLKILELLKPLAD